MRRLLLLALTALVGFGLILSSGCGDDDETTGPQEKQVGDPNDPAFQMASEFIGEGNFVLNMQLLMINFGLIDEYIDTSGTVGKMVGAAYQPLAEVIVTSYDTSNFWHIFECSAYVYEEGNYFTYGGIDSLRFGSDTGYMYYPDTASFNALNVRAHFNIDLESIGFTTDLRNHAGFDLTGEYEGNFTVNGYTADSADMYYTFLDTNENEIECIFGMTFDQEITDVVIDELVILYDACPPSGRMDLGFTMNLACEGESPMSSIDFSGNWVASFVFSNGAVNAVVENATTRWTYSEPCRDVGPVKPGWLRAGKQPVR